MRRMPDQSSLRAAASPMISRAAAIGALSGGRKAEGRTNQAHRPVSEPRLLPCLPACVALWLCVCCTRCDVSAVVNCSASRQRRSMSSLMTPATAGAPLFLALLCLLLNQGVHGKPHDEVDVDERPAKSQPHLVRRHRPQKRSHTQCINNLPTPPQKPVQTEKRQ